MDLVELVKSVPPESLVMVLLVYLVYRLIEWWRADMQAVNDTLHKLINSVTKLTVLIEIKESRKRSNDEDSSAR